MKNLSDFISDSPFATPAMKVKVIDKNGKVSKTYDAPAGFQLDLYVDSLYPDAELMITASNSDITVSVIPHGQTEILEIHQGVYQDGPTFH